MSWRQPESRRAGKIKDTQSARLAAGEDLRDLDFGFIDAKRLEAFQELPGRAYIEFLVARFDAKKKASPRCHDKTRHVEERVIRRWQTIHFQNSDGSSQQVAEIT